MEGSKPVLFLVFQDSKKFKWIRQLTSTRSYKRCCLEALPKSPTVLIPRSLTIGENRGLYPGGRRWQKAGEGYTLETMQYVAAQLNGINNAIVPDEAKNKLLFLKTFFHEAASVLFTTVIVLFVGMCKACAYI